MASFLCLEWQPTLSRLLLFCGFLLPSPIEATGADQTQHKGIEMGHTKYKHEHSVQVGVQRTGGSTAYR